MRATKTEECPAGLEGFAAEDLRAVDAQMWPIHPVMWLQPECTPAVPASGLHAERSYKVPMPGFLSSEIVLATRVGRPDRPVHEPLRSGITLSIPKTDIEVSR